MSIEFEVDPASSHGASKDLATGDQIVFNVEAVIHVDDGATTPILQSLPGRIVYAVYWRGALTQWSFPDTMEARASVTSEPIW